MGQSLGRGLLGSLRAQIKHEIRSLRRDNRVLRQARYPVLRRLLGGLIVDRSIGQFLSPYVLVLIVALLLEWVGNR
jgi:hypothetical protein